jgi:hypothetical protein
MSLSRYKPFQTELYTQRRLPGRASVLEFNEAVLTLSGLR